MKQKETVGPSTLARAAGGLYLVNILLGAFAIGVVPGMLVVTGDAQATAHNVAAHELLYRTGLAAHVVIGLTNVGLAVLFYELFKVVNRRLALLVAYFTLVATAIEIGYVVNQFAVLALLSGGPYASGLAASQVQSLAYLPVGLSGISYDVSTAFFAFYAITIGYLIFQSGFMPRAIGVLMFIDGVAYLVYGFADMLAPGFASHLVPWAQLPTLFGEGSLCLWLLVVGVNVQRWREVASPAPPATVGAVS
jgi:hypothetical protein